MGLMGKYRKHGNFTQDAGGRFVFEALVVTFVGDIRQPPPSATIGTGDAVDYVFEKNFADYFHWYPIS